MLLAVLIPLAVAAPVVSAIPPLVGHCDEWGAGRPCVDYRDDPWDCGNLGPRCVCVTSDGGHTYECVILPASQR